MRTSAEALHINSLPNEVLASVFQHVPEGRYPITDDVLRTLTSVCKRWRALVLKDPFFWAHITLDNPNSAQRLERRLRFSGNKGLVVRLDLTERPIVVTFNTTLNALVAHAHRLTYLDLRCRREDVSVPPKLNAPNLEALELRITPTSSSAIEWDIRAPKLHRLRMYGFVAADWAAVLSSEMKHVELQHGLIASASVLHSIIQRCPELQVLHLSAPIMHNLKTTDFSELKPLRLKTLNLPTIREITVVSPVTICAATALLQGFGTVDRIYLYAHGSIRIVSNVSGAERTFKAPRRIERNGSDELIFLVSAFSDIGGVGDGVFSTVSDVTVAPGPSWCALSHGTPLGAPEVHINILLDPGDFFSYRFKWNPVHCEGTVKLRLICADTSGETIVNQEDVDYISGLLGHKRLEPELVRVRMARSKDEDFERLFAAVEERMGPFG
ncbi:hypothetical protein BKA62DRAFT_783948 [Auriculariales sp. MPI-PUGE-AT-0066]|nr:hypothetical protein BKA62DRAFT_783948 [Auriculariales sp. MPI-PUGE-AT-0066]